MKKILKYRVHIIDEFTIRMPKNARILSVQTQGTLPQMWALVDTNDELTEVREFRVVATGQQFDSFEQGWEYIGTFQTNGGGFVGHLFEVV